MMEYSRQITRTLHQEHLATLGFVDRLDTFLAQHRGDAPAPQGADLERLLGDLRATIGDAVAKHFDFEESRLFPALVAGFGDNAMVMILTQEHEILRPLAKQLVTLAGIGESGFEPATWSEFHRQGWEYVERMVSHIQKEEMGLFPALEDVLDDEQDASLLEEYAMSG